MFIATVPLLILGYWVEETAMEKELAAVREKHLLVAQNLTGALERYAVDAKAIFDHLIDTVNREDHFDALSKLVPKIGLLNFRIIDAQGRVIEQLPFSGVAVERIPSQVMKHLRPFMDNVEVKFSDVMPDSKGKPAVFLTRKLASGNTAIAALSLEYIRKVQKTVQFGRKGHTAIVDRTGTLMAHPNAKWAEEMRNLSKVKPVAKMMAGETGVTIFYSPAVKKEMISGFTTVPSTGWGVMVPQPLEELEERASDVNRIALMLIAVGLIIAAFISWVLSGLIVRPVEAVVKAAQRIQDGYLEARVPRQSALSPIEFHDLGNSFNSMARDIATVMMQRERVEGELREAHDELEERVRARTRELTEEIAERQRAEETSLRLAGAIEGLSELFVLYDADDRLVMCNEKYREQNKMVAAQTVPGTSFEDHQRALIDKGEYPNIEGKEEEWLKERIRRHRNPEGPFEMNRSGRWLLVHEQRLPDGSTVTMTTDITERKLAEERMRLSEERLRGAIESMQEGFALFDAEDRLTALNEEYRSVNPMAQKIMEDGGTYEDLIRANVATGKIVEAEGREEEFIQERIAAHKNPKGPIIRKFIDGSWFLISEAKTPEGGIALSFIDITELKEAEVALESGRKRFQEFAEVASDWFWEMDADLRFSYFSGRNFDVTGYTPSDLIGKTRREMTKEKLQDEKWRRHLDDLDAHRPFKDFSYALIKSDGSEIYISISGVPLFNDEGNFIGYRGTGTDVSAQIKVEAALRETKEEAEFANRAKTEFLANMSHELRTPLNSVIGFSEILMTDTFGTVENPKVREYMEDINNSGKHLLELINDVLDVARIERGMMDLNEKKLDIPLLMASCQRLVNDRAFDAGVIIESNISKTLPALFADELRIKQILLNLLSNAIKFTPEGGTVSLKAGIDPENCFQLSIKDTGIGIARENIHIALSDFGQVDGSLAKKYDGTGLGLPLSKKLIELHGGELSIKSKPGVGTTVTIRFPKERTIILPS